MNTPNPLIPGGAFSQVHYKHRSNVRLAVFTILAVHVVLLAGLLMQGCRPKKTEQLAQANTNESVLPPLATNDLFFAPSNPAPVSNPATNPPLTTNPAPEISPLLTQDAPAAATSEYTVVKNDNFAKIAKAHGISLKALTQANPTVDPARLRPGQKLLLPASARTIQSSNGLKDTLIGTSPSPAKAHETAASIYVVKSGDTLAKIAREHATTVKAIRAANNLKTDQIKVGQKLKVPGGNGRPAGLDTNKAPALSP